MKVHCIRHEVFEDIGCISDWILTGNHQISYTHVFLKEELPADVEFDFLIIMGGSASVYDLNKYPWIDREVRFIKKAIDNHKKILGICLGSQLIAKALDGDVYQANTKEIGWFPVTFNKTDLQRMPFLPAEITTFHWHGDTFDLPEGAIRLASSKNTLNQGFIYGKDIMALQFHPEMTSESITMILNGAGNELAVQSESIHSSDQIVAGEKYLRNNNNLMFDLLNFLSD
jgi:GMP synthase-like glutamine amidotransferase